MGVLPLQYLPGEGRASWGLSGEELFSIPDLERQLSPGAIVQLSAQGGDGSSKKFSVQLRIDTQVELLYFQHGGILPFVLRKLAQP
jgi:aconitate hydratase